VCVSDGGEERESGRLKAERDDEVQQGGEGAKRGVGELGVWCVCVCVCVC
jgi:hypothetical protein